ncbi:Sperm-associated antigen 4 protein [Sciurus carolinensis]|uniref:Sperm-associated antigen 4 protein n=1 Tax=Sciurus carolinensis TaxID=30640 RepID=A0AA41MCB4_SCICA|nr:Sperm-associated antigen 4 protein [Sciurus carolinensis]
MRRSPRPGSAASPHKPNFYSDNSNSSDSVISGDSSGHRSAGPGPREPEGRRAGGSSCGEPALSPGLPGGPTWAGRSRQKPASRSHKGQTACGAATVRGGASGLLFQVLSVVLSLVGDALVNVYREVFSVRFLITAVSLLSVFLAGLCYPVSLYEGNPFPSSSSSDTLPGFLQHSGGGSCTWSLLWRIEYHERVRSQGQQLQQLQAELDKLHKEVSNVRAAHSERVAKLVFQRLNEDFVRKPDYALSSVGASIDLEKTSHDYEDTNTAYFWNRFSFWNYARPPSVILEPDVFPGNCWAFEGDQGQVVIRLPGRVELSDITLQHPPPSVAHTGGANSAPRDFAVFGLQVDDETEVFLGKFTFDVKKSEIQTFHLQNDPPSAFPKVKIQILSNWGHPRFTCLYRVRAHGVRTSEEAGDSAMGATGGSH